jgi:uncharacterized C2H2 Zn-finger protein
MEMDKSVVESGDPMRCPICSKIFSNVGNKNKHLKTVHKSSAETENVSNEFMCTSPRTSHGTEKACRSQFRNQRELSTHRYKVHFKDFKCEQCDRIFGDKGDLNKHVLRVHTKEKNYECENPECDRTFFARQELARHLTICSFSPRGTLTTIGDRTYPLRSTKK